MMFRHVVMFSWADDVDDAHIAAVSAALDTLPGTIDVLRAYRHGPDVVVADLDNADDFATYRDHPDHVAVIQGLLAGRVEQRAAVQYETS